MRDLIEFASSPEGQEAFRKLVKDNVAKSDPTIKLTRIALKTFFNVASDWELTPSDQMILLGGISKSSFYKYKKAPEGSIRLTRDVLSRTSYVAAIQHALFQYFETKKHVSYWISSKNTGIPFNGLSPLQYMLQGEMEHLRIVRQHAENLLI